MPLNLFQNFQRNNNKTVVDADLKYERFSIHI
jgi:hypothetical protein